MRTEIQKVLNIRNYFKIIKSNEQKVKYIFENPSRILLKNIHLQWLHSIWIKTHKHLPVFLRKVNIESAHKVPFAFISKNISYDIKKEFEHNLDEYSPNSTTELKFNLVVPEPDIMQYFIQWQRYRKYWWSSITTTPSLFGIDDIKYGDGTADVNIIAKFPWGQKAVETVTIDSRNTNIKNTSCLSCAITLEGALFILLLDGLINSSKEEYLRIHRKMAPYKISFALDSEVCAVRSTLNDLATLIHHRLETRKVSPLLPDLTLSLETQIKQNLQMGVAYTAILKETTLESGIFHLLSSNTMLTEQVHISDFDSYAAQICGK